MLLSHPSTARVVARQTHTFELLALILLADYDKLADRFVGRMPQDAAASYFGVGTHDKTKVERPRCVMSHDEARDLLKARLRACWHGPRATHNDAKLASKLAGQSFTRAHEWDEGGTLGWDEHSTAPTAAEPKKAK